MKKYYLNIITKQFSDFKGRARRKEYWMFILFNTIFSIVFSFVDTLLIGSEITSNLYSLVVLVPSIAVGIRRMHDVGKSGWFILIPIYNLILAIREGDKGENEYGQDPKVGTVLNNDILDV